MESRPDSALSILDAIDTGTLGGKKDKARYALLKSIALDKNYIDTTTFGIINPAVEYYTKHGTPDERFGTYYYYGRIFQNQGNDDEAMKQFMNAMDIKSGITDSMLLARNLVAMGTLYFKQYRIDRFIETNLEAAKLYTHSGDSIHAIKCLANVIDGHTMMHDKAAADSVLSICVPLVKENPDSEGLLFSSVLLYTIEFGTDEEIAAFLDKYRYSVMDRNEALDFAQGYSKTGRFEKALDIVSGMTLNGSVLDSLKYLSVKTEILERHADYRKALTLYKEYSAMLERYHRHLLSQDLLFADERHQLELANLLRLKERDRIIRDILCGVFALLLLVCWLYFRYRLNRSKRLMAEKDNENLRMARENLNREKEMAELERDRKTLEAANLALEINRLVGERDNLKTLLKEQKELSQPVQGIIKTRLDMLNGLLAKEIANNDSYAKPYLRWVETMRNDKNEFMNSTRLAFAASHPRFIEYLQQHGLTVDEINYLCLYAIGLRGKEVGEYIQLKRHYNISSEIRKKLGIDEHETNIGGYVRRMMNEL